MLEKNYSNDTEKNNSWEIQVVALNSYQTKTSEWCLWWYSRNLIFSLDWLTLYDKHITTENENKVSLKVRWKFLITSLVQIITILIIGLAVAYDTIISYSLSTRIRITVIVTMWSPSSKCGLT